MDGSQRCSVFPPCSTCGGMGSPIIVVSPQSSTLSLHHLGETPTAGLETKLYRKLSIKVESSSTLRLGGEGGAGQ